MADTLELTERELAIAAGDDPDQIETPVAVPDQSKPAAEAAATPAVVESSQDANGGDNKSTAGSKEAASTITPPASNPAWINQEARDYAASYGLSEAELKDYGSLAELRRAGAIFDKQITKAKPAPIAPTATATAPAIPATPTAEQAKKFVPYDIEDLKKQNYDDFTIKIASEQNEIYAQLQKANERAEKAETGTAQIQQRFQQDAQRQEAAMFHQAADTLDETRFGRVATMNPSADGNRKKLYEAALLINSGIKAQAEQQGVQPVFPTLPVLLKRAEALAFADEIRADERKRAQDELAAQSRRRRPVGTHKATRPVAPAKKAAETQDDMVGRILADPANARFFKDAQEANGSAV